MIGKRQFVLRAVAAALCLSAASFGAYAQEKYPARTVKIVVPFTAGSQVDLVAREIARNMGESFKQPVIVENRPGAGGTVGSRVVAGADGDGYTLLFTSASHAINATLYAKLPYDTLRDFSGVSLATSVPNVLVVAPSLGVKSTKELVALVKAKPGGYNFASAGIGSGTHFNGEMFKAATGMDIVHVPYKGTGDALLDTAAGRSAFYWSPLGLTLPFIKDNRLIPLAVSTAKRAPLMPDVPTAAEDYPAVVYDHWYGMMAPSKTPRPIVEQLSSEVARILKLPATVQNFAAQGVVPLSSTPAEFDRFIASEIERLGKVVKSAGIKVE
jgi:tripartite-type tricarboxylate transporter receptor subunit TctC